MSSLLTNTAAMTALTTLKNTNQDLEKSSGRIATGQKVATAADNAAYWSIATTIRADNGSLNAVKDAIGLGLSTVNTAITGLDAVNKTFLDLKNKLTAALNPNVDRNKIQTEIASRLTDLRTSATTATMNGEAWLATDSGAGNYTSERKIVASFARVQGQISVGTVTVKVDETKLYDAKVYSDGTKGASAASSAGASTALATWGAPGATTGAQATWAKAQTDFAASDKGASALATRDAAFASYTAAKASFDAAVVKENAGATAGKDGSGGILDKKWAVTGADENGFNKAYQLSVDTIDIAAIQNQDLSKLRAYVNMADKVLNAITDVATKLGTVQSQIQSQSNYVDTLIKGNDKSIGILVDADMEEESTKLKALQVQQQLGVQSLTIANTTTQQILSLFRS
ncbi:flagellin [Methylobacterium brachiatum]|uniref:flagellin N-terminal helical domain-containing protein n=1 Tax=Methylobacterium brachiatum TaxID=269660 RepID=UPI00244991A9|nr:flagellin [Methylobacterium brachiatum]MDH2312872.1 flagellin [Methylobacterium brachiatum]